MPRENRLTLLLLVSSSFVVLGGLGYVFYQSLFTVIPALLTWLTTPAPDPGVLGEGILFMELMVPAFSEWAPRAFPGFVVSGVGVVGYVYALALGSEESEKPK